MNRKVLNSVIAIAAGIALIFLRDTALNIVVSIVGALLLMVAAVNAVAMIRQQRTATASKLPTGSIIASATTAIVGLWMLITPDSLTNLIIYVIAAIMVIVGCSQLYGLHFGNRGIKLSPMLDILPALVAISGLVVFFIGADDIKSSLLLLSGIALIVGGVGGLLQSSAESAYRRANPTTTLPDSPANTPADPF